MLIVDAHQDIGWSSLTYGRNYRTITLKIREYESGLKRPPAATALVDALLGRVAIVFATLFVPPAGHAWLKFNSASPSYLTPRAAHDLALKQFDYYQRLADEDDRLVLIRSASDLDAVLATWEEGLDYGARKQGLFILMEGADPILEPKQFEEWYERGVRAVAPAWGATRYSGGMGEPGGLSALGHELLGHLRDFNAILDLSNMAEQAFNEALDRFEGIVIASHSNPRRFCDRDRHLSDAMIRRLAERDGVMGMSLLNISLSDDWQIGDPRPPLSIVADVIDHVCQITGSAAHIGIGSDFDSGYVATFLPAGIDSEMDLLRIAEMLRTRGFAEADIEAVMSGNFLRKLRESLA